MIRFAIAALLSIHAAAVAGAELTVYSTIAMTEAWHDLKPAFEARGHKLNLVLATSGALAKRLSAGDTADVLVSTAAGVDSLAKEGRLAGTGREFAKSGMGVAVRKGAPKPDISTVEAFKQALLSNRVAYSDPSGGGASGIYFVQLLDKFGIAPLVNARAVRGKGVPNAEFVVKGEADIAIQQIPELMSVKGAEVIGPLPAEIQNTTVFAAGVLASSTDAAASRALVDFLASHETAMKLKALGFEGSGGH
ncbi:MAG TPA: substrate-binding domain-containing protein [Burkholderiales bacterium]